MKENVDILLVEDNDLDVAILKRALKKIGASNNLVRTSDGEEALQILKEGASDNALTVPYVILLDINMPRIDGHEFLAAIRATEELKDTRVFVFTTSDSQKDIGMAYQNNANGYIVKPDSSSELNDILKSLLNFLDICKDPPVASEGLPAQSA